jgi:hypothetical protein
MFVASTTRLIRATLGSHAKASANGNVICQK